MFASISAPRPSNELVVRQNHPNSSHGTEVSEIAQRVLSVRFFSGEYLFPRESFGVGRYLRGD